jgi:hypothetical protein
VKRLTSKMLHKTQSPCCPNLIFADVLNNRSKVRFEDLEYIIVLECISEEGYWKGHFIIFEMSIK